MVEELREERPAPVERCEESLASEPAGMASALGDDVAAQLDAARAEATASWEKYLRCRSEMENYRRRIEASYAQLAREGRRTLLRRFLEVLDNFERALACGGEPTNPAALLEGVELTRRQFLSLLEQEGVRPIPALGQPFDPRLHEAVGTRAVPEAEGTVIAEALRGYKMGDDLLRPARVIVATTPGAPS